MENEYTYTSPVGEITVFCNEKAVTAVRFGKAAGEKACETDLIKQVVAWLDDYFSGKSTPVSFPIEAAGTDFQKRVWSALLEIPYGETRSYSQIAERIGCNAAVRAVGQACNKNPVAIMVPCHRVVGKSGKLVGYEYGTEIKQYLLEHERRCVANE